jgi:hypothetical protein
MLILLLLDVLVLGLLAWMRSGISFRKNMPTMIPNTRFTDGCDA